MIVVCTAGTADIPVAEEAAQTAEFFGNRVERVFDAGVTGIHRLLDKAELLQKANCVIAIAGMEGALASVIGGLVDKPVIAVPTSVGYGASFHGLSALLTMINSCANSVAVVNIDNGYGAGFIAGQINRLGEKMSDRNIYLECETGISGDMMVAALLDLGADRQVLEKVLAGLPADGFSINISRVKRRASIFATSMSFLTGIMKITTMTWRTFMETMVTIKKDTTTAIVMNTATIMSMKTAAAISMGTTMSPMNNIILMLTGACWE